MSLPLPKLPPEKPPQPATVAELLAIPEERRRHELIDGELIEKSIATGRHGGAQAKTTAKLDPYNRRAGRGGPGGWIIATEVQIRFAADQAPRPDVAGWRRERMDTLPADPVITVIPDWICEILSPSNATNDTVRKKRLYYRHRVTHYWIIDPIGESLTVYRWTPDGYLEVLAAERSERVRAEPFEAIDLLVGVFFGDDDDGDPAP